MYLKTIVVATLLAGTAYAVPAHADAVLAFQQVGTDVFATLSGSLDIDGLTATGPAINVGEAVTPAFASVQVGVAPMTYYEDQITGPASWGAGTTPIPPTSSSGDSFTVSGAARSLFLPAEYTSNSSLNSTMLFANNTLAAMGFTLGDYGYEFPSGDTLTVRVGDSPVPEPATMLLVGSGFGLATLLGRRKRKA